MDSREHVILFQEISGMKDENKTKQQLIDELEEMRQRIAELKISDTQ